MRVNKARHNNHFIISIAITFITIFYFIYIGISDTLYLLLSGINSFICAWYMFSNSNRPFTMIKVLMLFTYTFFVLANAIQFVGKINVLTFNYVFQSYDYCYFQFIILLILLLYIVIYSVTLKNCTIRLSTLPLERHNLNLYYNVLILLSIISTCITIALLGYNPYKLFFRGLSTVAANGNDDMSTSMTLIFDKFVRPIPFCVLTLLLMFRSPLKYRIIGLCCMIIALCPTGLARNAAAMYWLPIFILYMGNRLKHNIFMWAMFIGLFFIFPFLNVFRRWNGSVDFEWSMDFLGNMNFDASQLFMAVLKDEWITNGYQLLGPLFFYVPRSWWPDKPIGSGHTFTSMHHAWFNNVSMPYFCEGYINFGFIGIILFTVFIAWSCAKLDALYWCRWRFNLSYKVGYYLIFIGALIFIMRGDLLSSFAYTIGTIAAYIFTLYIGSNVKLLNFKTKK